MNELIIDKTRFKKSKKHENLCVSHFSGVSWCEMVRFWFQTGAFLYVVFSVTGRCQSYVILFMKSNQISQSWKVLSSTLLLFYRGHTHTRVGRIQGYLSSNYYNFDSWMVIADGSLYLSKTCSAVSLSSHLVCNINIAASNIFLSFLLFYCYLSLFIY